MPNSTDEMKKSATPFGVTLSKMTATDIAVLAIISGIDPGKLFDSISKNLASI